MDKVRHWSSEEDEILRWAVELQTRSRLSSVSSFDSDLGGGGDEVPLNWHEIASHLRGRTNKDCRKRWVYAAKPTINKGPWCAAEDQLLLQGVQIHGTKWADVSKAVVSRQPDQCSRRWHEVLKPTISRDRWSLFEDEMLKKAVMAHGNSWIEIVERYFPERTPIATRRRYNQLIKRDQSRPEFDLSGSPGSSWGSSPASSI